jgi:hypothetical protein
VADKDTEILEQLRQAASDLTKEHNVDHFVYFPTEDAARAAAAALVDRAYRVEVSSNESGSRWVAKEAAAGAHDG